LLNHYIIWNIQFQYLNSVLLNIQYFFNFLGLLSIDTV